MKRTFIIILVTLVALGLFIACDNNVQTDYNYLSEDQKEQYELLGTDVTKVLGLVTFNAYGTVTSSPKGVSAMSTIAQNGEKKVAYILYTFDNYEGNSGTINGTLAFTYAYDSLSDLYPSSGTGTTLLTSEKGGVTHRLACTATSQMDKNTGATKSVVETGTFDGAKYRETTTY